MSLFQDILSGITNRLQKEGLNKENVINEINNSVGVLLKPDQISIKNKTLFISASPTIKSIIYIKKNKLLEDLSKYNIKSIV